VKEWFGDGEPKAIPHDVSRVNRIGSCYRSNDGSEVICFAYRLRVRDIHDVVAVYGIETKDGVEQWSILFKNE
jgi:hypothetical protein